MNKGFVQVDPKWLAMRDDTVTGAQAEIALAQTQLRFGSNAGFMQSRGRTAVALEHLKRAQQLLTAAQLPWLIEAAPPPETTPCGKAPRVTKGKRRLTGPSTPEE